MLRTLAIALCAAVAAAAQCGLQCTLNTDCSQDDAMTCQHCVRNVNKTRGFCACSSAADTDIAGATIATECCGLQPFDCCDRCIGGLGKATDKCAAAVWANESGGTCTYKSSLTGFYKGTGVYRNSTAGRVTIFPELFPTVYACDAASLQCKATAGIRDVKEFWLNKEDCEAVCVAVDDPCKPKDSCSACLADARCGWCSQNVVYRHGQLGSQCASVGQTFQCPAQFSKNTCTGTDGPIQTLSAGQTPAEFIAKFTSTVLHGTDTSAPQDFHSLADIVKVAPGGNFGAGITAATVGAFLSTPSLPAAVKAKLIYAIPALMFAQGGKTGVMTYQTFNLKDAEGVLTLAFASTHCSNMSDGQSCEVAYVYGEATAHVIQQYTTYHVGCCSCHVGGCGSWIHFGCHGCDRQTPRDDTPAEVARIKSGLQAAVHSSFATAFPVRPQQYLAANGENWSLLKGLLRAFVNKAQQTIGRHSDSSTVTKVQTALKDISDDVNVLKIPQVAQTDIHAAIQTGARGVPQAVIDGMAQWVADETSGARNTSGKVAWSETESIQSDGVTARYLSVRIYYDPAASPYVDLVICAYQDEMHLEKLTIKTTSSYSANGTAEINVTSDSSPITGKDLEQFEIMWKYSVDDAVLKILDGAPKGHVTTRMRLLPFRLKAARRAAAQDYDPNGVFDSLAGIIKTASGMWQGIVSAFGSKTSTKIQIISQGGFTKFNEATESFTVPGVTTADTQKFIGTVMSEYSEETTRQVQESLTALLFAHGNDTASWLRQHIVWGENKTAGGCGADHGCAEFFIAHLNAHLEGEGANHWAICAYHTDFVLAPTIELITTSTSKFGGLFTSDHDEIRQLPATFTPADETHLRQFMGVQCQYMLGEALGMQGLTPPVFPSSELLI